MLLDFTKAELIEINLSVSQNLQKFRDTLKEHEKKSLNSVFDKTFAAIEKCSINKIVFNKDGSYIKNEQL
jgi:hypothetical protein